LIILSLVLLAGCTHKEVGEIKEENREAYYYKTEYDRQPFLVIYEKDVVNGKQVTFATTDDIDCSKGIYSELVEPNTYIVHTFTDAEYNKLIGGYSVFEWSGVMYTVVVPNGDSAQYYTLLFDEADTKTAIRAALNGNADSNPLNEEYLRKWKFIWYKL